MYIYIYIVLLVYAEDIIDPQINSCMLLLLDLLFVNSFVVFAFSDKKKIKNVQNHHLCRI